MGGFGVAPVVPQRDRPGRGGAVTQEMLQGWLSKLGAGAEVDMADAAQTIPTSTSTAVQWSRATMDTHGFWTPTAPTLLTVPRGLDGVYIASGAIRWDGNIVGSRTQSIAVTIASGVMAQSIKATTWDAVSVSDRWFPFVTRRLYLAAGDSVRATVFQDSGGDLDLVDSADGFLQLTRVGDLPREARVL